MGEWGPWELLNNGVHRKHTQEGFSPGSSVQLAFLVSSTDKVHDTWPAPAERTVSHHRMKRLNNADVVWGKLYFYNVFVDSLTPNTAAANRAPSPHCDPSICWGSSAGQRAKAARTEGFRVQSQVWKRSGHHPLTRQNPEKKPIHTHPQAHVLFSH